MFPMKEVRHINVPMYDELAVKHLWPEMMKSPEFAVYFPDTLPKGRTMCR